MNIQRHKSMLASFTLPVLLLITAPLVSAKNITINSSLSEACKLNAQSATADSATTVTDMVAGPGNPCLNSINTYFDEVITTRTEAKLDVLMNQKRISASQFSDFQQRALKTRAGSYAMRLDRMALTKACALQDAELEAHITEIADELSFNEQQRQTLIDSVNRMVDRQFVC